MISFLTGIAEVLPSRVSSPGSSALGTTRRPSQTGAKSTLQTWSETASYRLRFVSTSTNPRMCMKASGLGGSVMARVRCCSQMVQSMKETGILAELQARAHLPEHQVRNTKVISLMTRCMALASISILTKVFTKATGSKTITLVLDARSGLMDPSFKVTIF